METRKMEGRARAMESNGEGERKKEGGTDEEHAIEEREARDVEFEGEERRGESAKGGTEGARRIVAN